LIIGESPIGINWRAQKNSHPSRLLFPIHGGWNN